MQVKTPSICGGWLSVNHREKKQWLCRVTYDEDPPPPLQVCFPVELHESIGEDPAECRSHAADQVKPSIALLQLVARVPCAEKIDAAGIETGLEDAEDDAQDGHHVPGVNEAEALEVDASVFACKMG